MTADAQDIAQFRELVTNYRKPAELIRRSIRMLLHQQFVFGEDRGCREIYELLADFECVGFFEAYFACAGYEMTIDRHRRVVALLPPANPAQDELDSMSLHETIVLLLCRARFDEAILQGGKLEDGNAPWHTDALYDAWRETTGREPPNKGRMLELLRQLRHRTLISGTIPPGMGEGIAFAIRPSIAYAITGDAIQMLARRAAGRAAQAGRDETEAATAEPMDQDQ